MKQNIFKFGDTYWLQNLGIAMGTAAAVEYAYLYIGYLEMTSLFTGLNNHILYYKRYIDDGIGIWYSAETDSDERFADFMKDLNQWRY